jgi:hypothetical protein
VFVSCGQANDVCSSKDAGLLYVFFPGAFNDQAYWDNNDAMFLARVPEAEVTQAVAYECVASRCVALRGEVWDGARSGRVT